MDSARCTNDHVVTQEDEERSSTHGEERLQSCLPLFREHQAEMTTYVTTYDNIFHDISTEKNAKDSFLRKAG